MVNILKGEHGSENPSCLTVVKQFTVLAVLNCQALLPQSHTAINVQQLHTSTYSQVLSFSQL